MEKKEQLYEGKAKKVFATDQPDEFWFHTKTTLPPLTVLSAEPLREKAQSTTG